MDSASQESLGVQGALAFAAASTLMRMVRALMVGVVFGVPGTAPPWHTPHALHLQKNIPSGLFGSSVLDTLMTIWRKEDKFKGKRTDIMGERRGEWECNSSRRFATTGHPSV